MELSSEQTLKTDELVEQSAVQHIADVEQTVELNQPDKMGMSFDRLSSSHFLQIDIHHSVPSMVDCGTVTVEEPVGSYSGSAATEGHWCSCNPFESCRLADRSLVLEQMDHPYRSYYTWCSRSQSESKDGLSLIHI